MPVKTEKIIKICANAIDIRSKMVYNVYIIVLAIYFYIWRT